MLNWLRSLLGESAELAQLRTDLSNTRAKLAITRHQVRYHQVQQLAAIILARAAQAQAAALAAVLADVAHRQVGLARVVDELLEPAASPICDKVRLRDRDEAAAFARRVEQQLGLLRGAMVQYRCKACPRHPLSLDRFWQITNSDPERRGYRNPNKPRPRRGPGLITHVDPARLQALRNSLGGGDV